MFDSTYLETFRKPGSGFSLSGSGSFSSVFLSPCGEYAVKSSDYGYADGWILYAAALLAQGDILPEWAPKIYHMQFSRSTGMFVALMDSYEPDGSVDFFGAEVRPLWECYTSTEEPLDADAEVENCVNEMARWRDLRECVEFLYNIEVETGVPLFLDIFGNCMWNWRSENLVFTDPVCFMHWSQYKKGNINRKVDILAFLERCATKTDKIRLVN